MEIKTRQIVVLMSSMFIFTLGFSIILPVLPYIIKEMNANAFDLCLLLASFSATQFLFAPFWGKVSDRIGRKPVLAIALLGFSISFVLIGLSGSILMILIWETIGGALSAGIYPAALAYIADISRPAQRGRLMGLMGASSGLGIIFGPALGGYVAQWGLMTPFFLAAIISFLTLVFGYVFLPESYKGRKHSDNGPHISILSALKMRVGIFFVVALFIAFAAAGFEGTYSYYVMDRFHLSAEGATDMSLLGFPLSLTGPGVMSIVCTAMSIVSVICQGLLVGKAIDRFGEEKTILFGLLVGCGGLLLLLTSFDLLTMIVYSSIISIGFGLVNPCLNTLVSEHADEDHQGVVLGVLGAYGSLGRIAGPVVGGATYLIMVELPYIISAAISAVCAVTVFTAISRHKSTKEPLVVEQAIQKQ